MKIAVPAARLTLKTYAPVTVRTSLLPVYNVTVLPVMVSVDDVVAVARGPPVVI